ncbi:hypothetical protein [Streptomyces zaehneri]|uniref:hypothetical protein n=1 Tax=Streptomyces zaehneri TaxID=3051180 RepID=UPI0028D6DEC6|nr:hypothetical protein [Streptomyces sp. DSM 40713]
MDLHDELPPAGPAMELLALAEDHHARTVRPPGTREVAGHPARERDAFARQVLGGAGPLGERLAAWGADTVEGNVR